MAIKDQFEGLDSKELIDGPLKEETKASDHLSQSTSQFIKDVAFNKQNKVKKAESEYTNKIDALDDIMSHDNMNDEVPPLLAIVPIPNLQIDEIKILFDMEVKESERSESSKDYNGSISGQANFGIFKATVSGSASSHESNTHSSDGSPKYHVDVHASHHGTPEGLARVLDMMIANIAPELVGSTVVGEDGKILEGQRKERAQKLKQLQVEIMDWNKKTDVAKDSLAIAIEKLKESATSCQNQYISFLSILMDQLDESEESQEKLRQYKQIEKQISSEWTDFINNSQKYVETIENLQLETEENIFTKHILLTCIDQSGNNASISQELKNCFHLALEARKQVIKYEEETQKKQEEYNQLMRGG